MMDSKSKTKSINPMDFDLGGDQPVSSPTSDSEFEYYDPNKGDYKLKDFVNAPIPMEWSKAAYKAGGAARVVGDFLFREARKPKKPRDITFKVSKKAIAKELDVKWETVQKAVEKLKKAGLIEVDESGTGAHSYRIVFKKEWMV